MSGPPSYETAHLNATSYFPGATIHNTPASKDGYDAEATQIKVSVLKKQDALKKKVTGHNIERQGRPVSSHHPNYYNRRIPENSNIVVNHGMQKSKVRLTISISE